MAAVLALFLQKRNLPDGDQSVSATPVNRALSICDLSANSLKRHPCRRERSDIPLIGKLGKSQVERLTKLV